MDARSRSAVTELDFWRAIKNQILKALVILKVPQLRLFIPVITNGMLEMMFESPRRTPPQANFNADFHASHLSLFRGLKICVVVELPMAIHY
jgi:hypothetical protein